VDALIYVMDQDGVSCAALEGRMYHVTITTSHGAPLVIDHMAGEGLTDLLTQWRTGLSADVRVPTPEGRQVYVARRAIVHIVATSYR